MSDSNILQEVGGPDALVRKSGDLAAARHDLRTPIAHIIGYSEMLQEHATDLGQEAFLTDLKKIESAGRQLIGVLDELLGPSKSQIEEVDVARLRFQLRTALNHTIGYIEIMQEEAEEAGQESFLPDLRKVRQAATNLQTLIEGEVIGTAPPTPDHRGAKTADGIREAPGARLMEAGSLLIVDDNEANHDLLSRQLRRLNCTVASATSGPQALDMVREHTYDLVLLDVVMPGMDGCEVLERLKANEGLRHIPVIMLSALDEIDSVVRCILMGAEDYLSKPFDPVLLKARIGACLEKSHLRKQEQRYLRQIEAEQEKTERLLLNIMPKPIADRLRKGEETIVDSLPAVTVLFADLAGFTAITAELPSTEVVKLLDEIFCAFDLLAEAQGLEKIKTIGDAYLVVGGLPTPRADHAHAIAELALAMREKMAHFQATGRTQLGLRIGINSGPVIAGIIGKHKFSYDLWGDTVNSAHRMESHGVPGSIQITAATRDLLGDAYSFEPRGEIEVKGKGRMETYFLLGKNSVQSAPEGGP